MVEKEIHEKDGGGGGVSTPQCEDREYGQEPVGSGWIPARPDTFGDYIGNYLKSEAIWK